MVFEDKSRGRLVTVFGGSGFVARYIIRRLAEKGWRIRAACRRPELAGHLQPMGVVGQIHAVQANLRFPSSVAEVLEGADAAVNCVGVLFPTGKQTFNAVHDQGARTVASAAGLAGVRSLIHVSAIGADLHSSSHYARSKAAGEAAVLEEFPDATILRPSIIFGPEDDFFNRFARMTRFSPFLPLIGGGRTRFQPVYVGDVALAVEAVLEKRPQAGSIYEIGGPEILSFRQLLERTTEYVERKRLFLNLPFWLAKLQALGTAFLPNSLRPVTLDQIRLLEKDNVVTDEAISQGRTLAGLGIESPRSIPAIVPQYLECYKPKGQYSHYRI